HYLDCGTSGGVWGERNGFSIMVGGEAKIFKKVEPVFRALAAPSPNPSHPPAGRAGKGRGKQKGKFPPPGGEGKGGGYSYGLVGKSGAGHFVKMVHNGIEYGMMEAIAEGFAVLDKSGFKLNLAQVAKIWRQGSVVSSWLVELAQDIFEKEDFARVVGFVKHTGEGEWTVKVAKRLAVDVRVIADALAVRKESGEKAAQKLLRNKILALLRNRFGGHEVLKLKKGK
ncbi:MAG: hypothetical protein HY397_00745, partial [Candidatus Doudnabacteria bacterium]|nr:hypothetical protein [Candidatus Doudnabacteria bacterium]